MADLTNLLVPSEDIGLIPIPTVLGNLILSNRGLNFYSNTCLNLMFSSVPFLNSIPAYISSVFSLNIIISVVLGSFTGDGVPLNHLTGLTQAKRSNFV